MTKVLYPGSFDPITYGHMDVISQASKLFDEVIVCIGINPDKNGGLFSLDERKNIIEKIYANNTKIKVITEPNRNRAIVDTALEHDCNILIKGLRNTTDFLSEMEIANTNNYISDEKVSTIAIFAKADHVTISSSKVKQIAMLNKKISAFVHPIVEEAILSKLRSDNNAG